MSTQVDLRFVKLLVDLNGSSRICRVFFDEAHTVLLQSGFRGSYAALPTLTSLNIPCILLSATISPGQLQALKVAYSRPELLVIR
ncbi:hypothetical protein V1509DRAFT_91049 [Lipomyces kononenkoae]